MMQRRWKGDLINAFCLPYVTVRVCVLKCIFSLYRVSRNGRNSTFHLMLIEQQSGYTFSLVCKMNFLAESVIMLS